MDAYIFYSNANVLLFIDLTLRRLKTNIDHTRTRNAIHLQGLL
jgi:hypothetical protein